MGKEELLMQAAMLKQQSEEVEQQLNFIDSNIEEFEKFSQALESLDSGDRGKDMIASLGKGVFVKAQREEGEKLFVEVGAGVLVRKTPAEARDIVLEQMKKFQEARVHLKVQLEGYVGELGKMIGEIEKAKLEEEK